MPTYQYRCKSCSFEFEELQKNSDKPLKTCPSCKKETLVRNIGGGAGLVFKGSGFYQTDYKKSGDESKQETPEKKEKKPVAKTKSTSESKSETKSSESGSSKSKSDSTDSSASKSDPSD